MAQILTAEELEGGLEALKHTMSTQSLTEQLKYEKQALELIGQWKEGLERRYASGIPDEVKDSVFDMASVGATYHHIEVAYQIVSDMTRETIAGNTE